jgi:CheY-like chemotaxis protein
MNALVLVIQHDPLMREVISDILHAVGHTVVEADDACQALELLETHAFDLLVTCQQPEPMTGVVLALEAKTLRPRMPIILIGVNFIKDASLPFIEAIIQTPFSVEELQGVIEKTLKEAACP